MFVNNLNDFNTSKIPRTKRIEILIYVREFPNAIFKNGGQNLYCKSCEKLRSTDQFWFYSKYKQKKCYWLGRKRIPVLSNRGKYRFLIERVAKGNEVGNFKNY